MKTINDKKLDAAARKPRSGPVSRADLALEIEASEEEIRKCETAAIEKLRGNANPPEISAEALANMEDAEFEEAVNSKISAARLRELALDPLLPEGRRARIRSALDFLDGKLTEEELWAELRGARAESRVLSVPPNPMFRRVAVRVETPNHTYNLAGTLRLPQRRTQSLRPGARIQAVFSETFQEFECAAE